MKGQLEIKGINVSTYDVEKFRKILATEDRLNKSKVDLKPKKTK